LIAHSLPDALALCHNQAFIVGGAEIYAQSIDLADILYITEIQQEVDGDAHFPEFNISAWREVSREVRTQDSPQPLEYHFVTYQRN
jgi:dihydrofolate reductase